MSVTGLAVTNWFEKNGWAVPKQGHYKKCHSWWCNQAQVSAGARWTDSGAGFFLVLGKITGSQRFISCGASGTFWFCESCAGHILPAQVDMNIINCNASWTNRTHNRESWAQELWVLLWDQQKAGHSGSHAELVQNWTTTRLALGTGGFRWWSVALYFLFWHRTRSVCVHSTMAITWAQNKTNLTTAAEG